MLVFQTINNIIFTGPKNKFNNVKKTDPRRHCYGSMTQNVLSESFKLKWIYKQTKKGLQLWALSKHCFEQKHAGQVVSGRKI
jgi:hypothetical protein